MVVLRFMLFIATLICFLQRQQTLGNKIEMEITSLIEQNPTILRVGLHLEYNDARNRIATHLQRNLDRSKLILLLCDLPYFIIIILSLDRSI